MVLTNTCIVGIRCPSRRLAVPDALTPLCRYFLAIEMLHGVQPVGDDVSGLRRVIQAKGYSDHITYYLRTTVHCRADENKLYILIRRLITRMLTIGGLQCRRRLFRVSVEVR